jgi:hypothetical protein
MHMPFDLTADNKPIDGEDIPESIGNGTADIPQKEEKQADEKQAKADKDQSKRKGDVKAVPDAKPKGTTSPKVEVERGFVDPKDKFKT